MVHQKDDSDDEDAATLIRDWESHVLSADEVGDLAEHFSGLS